MPSGHASHQIGLDADVWLRLDLPPMGRAGRERLDEIKYVDYDRMRVTEDWTDRQARMIQIAAADVRVARIFVSPAIKLAMCQRSWTDRRFLNKLRPWHGHDGHMHIRLTCPSGRPAVRAADSPAGGRRLRRRADVLAGQRVPGHRTSAWIQAGAAGGPQDAGGLPAGAERRRHAHGLAAGLAARAGTAAGQGLTLIFGIAAGRAIALPRRNFSTCMQLASV